MGTNFCVFEKFANFKDSKVYAACTSYIPCARSECASVSMVCAVRVRFSCARTIDALARSERVHGI